METFFFGQPSRRLFGALDGPGRKARAGLVFCPPFGEEMITTYARFARWSKELAKKGFAVLRFHPFGTGESDGSFRDYTVEGALRDTVTAVTYLRERIGVERVGFFGLRFGAFLAAQAALMNPPDFLLLWSPITDTRQYFRELLRTRLTAELVHLKADRVRVTTKSMIADFEAGRTVDNLGYEFSPALYRDMTTGPKWPQQSPSLKVLWLSRVSERAQLASLPNDCVVEGGNAQREFLPELPFWEDFSSIFPEKFARASEAWLTAS